MNKEIKLHKNTMIVSETDEKGVIVYANNDFCDIAGFSKNEVFEALESFTIETPTWKTKSILIASKELSFSYSENEKSLWKRIDSDTLCSSINSKKFHFLNFFFPSHGFFLATYELAVPRTISCAQRW